MRTSLLAAAAFLCSVVVPCASATEIAFFSGQTVTTSSRTQFGTLALSGVPQTWTGAELYPGSTNLGTTYYFNTYTINSYSFRNASASGYDQYVRVTLTDTNDSGLLFLSLYDNSYNPSNLATNWLGDIGVASSSNGGVNKVDAYLPTNDNLVIVVNSTGTGGLNKPFDVRLDGFTAAEAGIAATPEPSSLALLGTGVLGIAGVMRKRFSRA